MERLSDSLYRFVDTCNVYAITAGDEAVLVDFGTGKVLEALRDIGVERVTDILMSHHHRDQGQGLDHARKAGARVWVPAAERELFSAVESHWQSRAMWNNYNVREDRFSLRDSIPIAGTLPEYRTTTYGRVPVTVVPLPGHTVGSVGFLAEVDGKRVAFTGDLIAAPGKVWSLAATQWSYGGGEGLAASVLSLLDLKDRTPDLLLPSHGEPMADPPGAIDKLVGNLLELLELRDEHRELLKLRAQPYKEVLPHLLWNWTAHAHSYVLLSERGTALMVDYGYDAHTGLAAGTDRASRRPWLYTIQLLKRQFGVERIDVAVPTHYHDDHVAGLNLLREIEGTQVWSPSVCAEVLENPSGYNLPCLWYEPVAVDRVVPLGEPIPWEEYELLFHHLPGHTYHAVALETVVDGTRVLFTGDQHDDRHWLNYVYQNRFRLGDYRQSGELYVTLKPELLLTGHWGPVRANAELLEELRDRGERLEHLHRALLPLDDADFDAEGVGAWIRPYQSVIRPGESVILNVEVRNPLPQAEDVAVMLVIPRRWEAEPPAASVRLGPGEHSQLAFRVVTPDTPTPARRAIVMADVQVGDRRFGQHAEAVVTIAR